MSTTTKITGAGLAMSVAMALAACGGETAAASAEPKMAGTGAPGMVSCKESNSCKGNGSCAGVAVGEKHTCKGQNGCGGNLREITAEECTKIKGTVASK